MALDPYQVLGVSRSASQEDIKNAYRKLARKLHPDLNPGNKDSERRFKEVSVAYDLIGTAEKREKFDRGETEEELLREARQRQGGAGPFYYETQTGPGARYSQGFGQEFESRFGPDIFESLFRRAAQGRAGRGQEFAVAGEDVRYSLAIDFRDSILGADKELALPGGKRLRIRIPSGVKSGTVLRFAGEGGPGMGGGPRGDAYIELQVAPSEIFRRNGADLEVDVPLSLAEAVLGGEVTIPTVEGAVSMKVPPGVNTGSRLRVRGKGVPDSRSGKRGDLFANVRVVLPDRIDPELTDAIREWSQKHPYTPKGRKAA